MKKILLICSIFFFGNQLLQSQTTLVPGDIAIVGYNSDEVANEDEFSFVLLRDITAGTSINFTDFGWCSDINGFQSANSCGGSTGALSDGALTWTASSSLPCGTQIYVVCGGTTLSASSGTVMGLQAVFNFPGEYMSLAVGGDQIFAFQGTLSSPTLITGLNMNGVWDASLLNCAFTSSQSVLPAALNASNSIAIAPEVDNARYNCIVTNDSPANLRTAIFSLTNWNVDNATPYTLPLACTFSCNACTNPTVPSVTATVNPVCVGNTTTLNISGTLNDATQWVIYSGSCGGTLVGTTVTSSFVVTPSAPNTTYFVRGEGGCVIPGSCGTITINVNNIDNASFSYGASSYCTNASDPTPTITGLPGGTFTSTAGLSINSSTGTIDVSASTPGIYTVTYTTAGSCPNTSNVSVTINALENASFSYGASSYCTNASDPTPTITGLPGGTFTSTAGLSINASTGTIDVSASTPNTYTVTYTTAGSCPNTSNVSVTIATIDNTISENTTGILTANASDGGMTYQWYECPNTLLTGETNQNFTPSSTGDYKVSISFNGCTVESSCYTVTTLGSQDFENNLNFILYPNPTTGNFIIKTTSDEELNVVNQLGQTVMTIKVFASVDNYINLEHLSKGVYILKGSNNRLNTKRLIIK